MTGLSAGCPSDTETYVTLSSQKLFNAAISLIRANIIQDPDGLLVSTEDQIDGRIQSSVGRNLEFLYNKTVGIGVNENCDLLHNTSQLGFFNSFMPHPTPLLLQVFVMVLTLLTNSITIAVFSRPAMHSPTNTLLTGIAVTDLLTVLLPLPLILLRLGTNILNDPITMLKGYLVQYFSNILPTVCHTAAIWLTVLLAIQRTIYVQMPLQAVHCCLCQPKAAKVVVLLTCLLAALSQLPGVLQTTYKYVITFCNSSGDSFPRHPYYDTGDVTWSRPKLIKCTHMPKHWYKSLLLLRVVTINLVPCITLTLLTILLTWALQRFTANRRRLLGRSKNPQTTTELTVNAVNDASVQHNWNKEERQGFPASLTKRQVKERDNNNNTKGATNSEKDSTSMMLLVILIVFLVAELPTTVLICLAMHQINYADQSGLKMGSEICNYIILLSYPANFFVYVSMSRPFRSNLKQLFPQCPCLNMSATLTKSFTWLPRHCRTSSRRHGDYLQGERSVGDENGEAMTNLVQTSAQVVGRATQENDCDGDGY